MKWQLMIETLDITSTYTQGSNEIECFALDTLSLTIAHRSVISTTCTLILLFLCVMFNTPKLGFQILIELSSSLHLSLLLIFIHSFILLLFAFYFLVAFS